MYIYRERWCIYCIYIYMIWSCRKRKRFPLESNCWDHSSCFLGAWFVLPTQIPSTQKPDFHRGHHTASYKQICPEGWQAAQWVGGNAPKGVLEHGRWTPSGNFRRAGLEKSGVESPRQLMCMHVLKIEGMSTRLERDVWVKYRRLGP